MIFSLWTRRTRSPRPFKPLRAFHAPEESRTLHVWAPRATRPGAPDYYGCVARLDECLGRLLGWLEAHDRLESTLVVFTTDHGCHFRTRNAEYKRCCHESAVRIPLVLAGPGFDTGRAAPELVSLIDLPPTLLDAARIERPPTFAGRSLTPLAAGPAADWPEGVFVQISEAEVGRAIRTRRWKYGVFAPEKSGRDDPAADAYVERYVYDLCADPHESVNLVGRGGFYRQAADELMARLKRRMVQAGEKEPEIRKAKYYA